MTSNNAGNGKSITSAIKSLLNSEYKFLGGDKVQEMFTGDVLKLFKEYNRDAWNLEVGQTIWFAVDKDEKQSYGKTLEKTRITPLILSVVHDEDRNMRANGFSHRSCSGISPKYVTLQVFNFHYWYAETYLRKIFKTLRPFIPRAYPHSEFSIRQKNIEKNGSVLKNVTFIHI